MTYDDVKKRMRNITKVFGSNRKCYICGERKGIQNHHLIKVADLSEACVRNQYFNLNTLYYPSCRFMRFSS